MSAPAVAGSARGCGWSIGTALAARILIVEDDPDTRHGLRIALSAIGHRVDVADDGQTALVQVAAHAPDLVLLDLGLPGMGGLEVLRRLRHRLPAARIVVLSAWDEQRYEPEALAAGATMYLEKPVTSHRLVEVVEELLH